MKYTCTRNGGVSISASEAILAGISPDGGLYLPESFPHFSLEDISAMAKLDYAGRAARVIGSFLEDFSKEELEHYTRSAYDQSRFGKNAAPVVRLSDSGYILELFHGPTSAFKDFALQMLPRLLTASARKNGINEDIVILVATSGDTGKAALEGFADIEGTRICVFYPNGGTSPIQKLQMTTQKGANVLVTAVDGNFDDAQSGVKSIFTDAGYNRQLLSAGLRLSSANSINWGRLVPQVAYYFSAYCDLVDAGSIPLGDAINICVPTGNFGNILAARIASICGLPVNRLICASNSNNVLTDFISTGIYDRNRPFFMTTSPSMDILISSNLERLLYLECGDGDQVKEYMAALARDGRYQVSNGLKHSIQAIFDCGYADDAMAADTIRDVFARSGYLADPHTAVAINVYEAYRACTGDTAPTIIASTASPFKFPRSVLSALGADCSGDEFALLDRLAEISGLTPPPALAGLRCAEERFTGSIPPMDMRRFLSEGFTRQ